MDPAYEKPLCPEHPDKWLGIPHSRSALKARMIANRWCCHQVDHLCKTQEITSLAYLAMNQQPSSSIRNVDHRDCASHDTCIAYNIDSSTYRTRHVHSNCTCVTLSVPYIDLIQIASAGEVPLISIEENSTTMDLQLHLVPRSRSTEYIAVSHVWSDGLGNPHGNSLPLCQIRRIDRLTTPLYKKLSASMV